MQSVRSAIVTLLGTCLCFASAWAVPAARIAQRIDNSRMTTLRGNVHPMARAEFDQGAIDPSQMLHRVMITFSRTATQQAALDKLLAEQQDPASPNYHQWLTPEEFGTRFGMADADLAKVKDWLTSKGFTIDEVARGANYIAFSGSAGDVNATFQTELHQYAMNGEVHVANATSVSVPAAMAGVVSSIRSLSAFKPHPRARRLKPAFTSSLSGNTYLAPRDFATIYNLNELYAAGIDGTGQKIAVMGQTDIIASDITTFRSVSNLPANAPQMVLVGPDPGVQDSDLQEADLDLEWAGAVAPKATIIYVNAGSGNGVFDSLYYAIDHNTAPVISISYGLCEPGEGSFITADEAELEQAAAQGQTVVGPAGDDGAADCDYSNNFPVNSARQGLAVDFPASSPVVTGVGGTAFNEGSGTYWSTTNDVSQGSALFYIPEVVWNDTLVTIAADQGFASTGGGASINFAKPSWQTGTGVPNDGVRDVPDVSFNASLTHDPFITCSNGSCQVCATTDANCASATSPGYRLSADGTLDVVGGTSAGVPTFAAVVALINQKTGTTQGNLNPRLYQLANGASGSYIFHDITSGDNKVPCTSGTPNCPAGTTTIGYSAGVGYDQTTGLGSVDTYNLVTNWSGTPPAADFGVSFFNPSVTVKNGSSGTMVLRLQKQNGFSGSVSFACSTSIPGVSCAVNPNAVTPDGTATVTITSAIAVSSLRVPAAPNAPLNQPTLPAWEYGFGVAALFVMGKKRGKREMVAIAVVALALAGVLTNCGGGGGGSSNNSGGGGNTTLPSLTLNPTSLTFNYQLGGTAPAAQTVTVGSNGTALNYTATATTTSGGNWLSVTPASGSTSGMESVTVNPSGLASGTYSGTVSFASSGAGNTPQSAPVTMTVATAAGTVTVTATSGSLSHTAQLSLTVN